MKKLLLFFLCFQTTSLFAQSLHPLEPIQKHYAEFAALSAEPNLERAELDQILFPRENYGAVAILYTMAVPAYLSQNQIDELKNSIRQPANSSDQTKAELEFLLNWQEKRTAAQIERTSKVLAPIGYWPHTDVMKDHPNYQKNLDHLFFEGREVLRDQCTAENYPATAKLLKGITKDMRIMEFSAKYNLLRPRPYHLEPKLKPLAIMSSPSFASGHTLWAYIHAFAWSELVPTKRKEFLDLAYEIGLSREIMGIHYPSDEEAARVLAHAMLTAMLSNPGFIEDLNAAKEEWKE